MSNSCIFCQIIKGEIPSDKVYEDGEILAFRDINPAAPTHLLIIPKEHIATLNDLTDAHQQLIGRINLLAKTLAEKEGLTKGYRLVANCLGEGGQEVYHIHYHVLGGRQLSWPPG